MTLTYVVTGRHRSGTSMMMRALDLSSDILAEYDPQQDELMKLHHVDSETYHPNPNGYYLSRKYPSDVPGKLIKVSTRAPSWLEVYTKPGEYLVVHMVRNEAERLQSWERAFGYPEAEDFRPLYESFEAKLLSREDCTICHVAYEDVIRDPLNEFKRLVFLGWPIDPEKAAALVDESLYRNRLASKE